MSCNGCRVLRKGCSENCILRLCLQWIETPEAQGHATIFVAKFFGRAGLMSFISAVSDNQRPALFQSLLFEAAGRTVNPVNGAVGLMWSGNWHVCQAAVETVLRGGTLRPIPELFGATTTTSDEEVTCIDMFKLQGPIPNSRSKVQKRRRSEEVVKLTKVEDLDLSLTAGFPFKVSPSVRGTSSSSPAEKRRPGTPSINSEDSVTTTCFESGFVDHYYARGGGIKLLNLFN